MQCIGQALGQRRQARPSRAAPLPPRPAPRPTCPGLVESCAFVFFRSPIESLILESNGRRGRCARRGCSAGVFGACIMQGNADGKHGWQDVEGEMISMASRRHGGHGRHCSQCQWPRTGTRDIKHARTAADEFPSVWQLDDSPFSKSVSECSCFGARHGNYVRLSCRSLALPLLPKCVSYPAAEYRIHF